MPAKSSRDTLFRLFELLKCLPKRKPGLTAIEIGERLEGLGFRITKRQILRDLEMLENVMEIQREDESAPFRWHWRESANTSLAGLTVPEALSLCLVEGAVKPLLPPSVLRTMEAQFEHARNKLDALEKGNPLARWRKKVSAAPINQPLLAPEIADHVLDTVQEALMADEQIDADYRPMNAAAPKTYRLHPLALVSRGPVTYLVATAWGYDDIFLYDLHRISAARRTYEASRRPPGFDLETYLASGALQFSCGRQIRLEARVSDDLARILSETRLSADQKIDDGNLAATVQDTWQLRWWLLGQCEGLIVTAPADLAADLRDSLAAASANYARGGFVSTPDG